MTAGGSCYGIPRLYQHCSKQGVITKLFQHGPLIRFLGSSQEVTSLSNKKAFNNTRGLHFQHSFSKPLTPLRWFPYRNTFPFNNRCRTGVFPLDYCYSTGCSKMSGVHLAKGSVCPPLQDGKIRLYNMKFCPFAQRAVLVAEAKGLPYEVVNCNLKDKPEWLFEKNPEGKVPVLETKDGKVLCESLIVADYLDEAYSQRPLSSKDSYKKAVDRLFVERFSSVISTFYKIIFAIRDSQPDTAKEHLANLVQVLKPFEQELTKRGTTFFGGDQPGMLDYMIWPWVERIPVFKTMLPDIFDYETAKTENPNLENWRQAMKKDSAVSKILLPTEQHQQFIESFLAGSPNYDP